MSTAVDLIKDGIAEAENELKGLDKRRDELNLKIKELRRAVILLAGGAPAPTESPAPSPAKGDRKLGEQVDIIKDSKGHSFAIYKGVRTAVLSAITSKTPQGEWFKPEVIYPAIAQFYKGHPQKRISQLSRAYMMFLEKLKFVEYNGRRARGSRYRWFPRFRDQKMTEEEVRKRIEEDRKALQDVMG